MDYSYEVARARHEERLRQAEATRTLQQVDEVRAGIQAKMLVRLGDLDTCGRGELGVSPNGPLCFPKYLGRTLEKQGSE